MATSEQHMEGKETDKGNANDQEPSANNQDPNSNNHKRGNRGGKKKGAAQTALHFKKLKILNDILQVWFFAYCTLYTPFIE